tara:strand:- start:4778 stop:5860 length:1083 start_codon:yes stop_codon:yes gene_type:complete
MWEVSNSGASPWATEFNGVSIRNSSYGPLHSVIGLFAKISSIFPKILFAISGFIIFLILVNAKKAHTKNFKTKDLLLVLLIYPLFPLTIITSYIYGINDSIVALIVIMACESRRQENMIATGSLLGFAALLKFYPILFLIFFALSDKRGISFRCILSGILFFCLGMFFAYLVWGTEIFKPLIFGADRGPKLLSIIKFLDYLNIYIDSQVYQNFINILINKNTLFMLGFILLVFLHGYMAEIEWEYVALVGVLVIFITYKVGHPQFFISWTVLLAWVITSTSPGSKKNLFAWRLTPIAIYLGLFHSLYFISGLIDDGHLRNDWQIVRDIGSLPFLIVVIVCMILNKDFFKKPWKKKEKLLF